MDMTSLTGLQNCGSVDEIQRVIEKLEAARDRLVKEGQQRQTPSPTPIVENNLLESVDTGCTNNNGIRESGDSLENGEDEELIDISKLTVEEDPQWLVKTVGDSAFNIKESEQDKSFMDLALLNVQNSLVNQVKRGISEQSLKEIKPSPRSSALNNLSVATPKQLFSMTPPTPLQHRMSLDSNSSDCSVHEPVLASSPLISKVSDLETLDVFETESGSNNINYSNYVGTPPRNIDTRTYTRPKKSRMSLDGHLQTTGCGLNTLTLRKSSFSTPLQRQQDPNKNNNLNETFVQEDVANSTFTKLEPEDDGDLLNTTVIIEPSALSARSRQVSRNGSYTISPKTNLHNGTPQDLNSTFVCTTADSSPSDNTGENCHNLSMEELHVMARLQEQSLKDASPQRSFTRKDTQVLMSFNNFDTNHHASRASSNDTYSLGQSNPDSPGSSASGLSSPLDAQSYDNLQIEAFRRSMPDLAISRRSSIGGPTSVRTLSLAPPLNLLLKSKPYHTSDPRVNSHPGSTGRLSMLPSNGFGYNKNKRHQSPDRSSGSSIEANTLTMTRSRIYSAAPISTGINSKSGQRSSTGSSMPQPRQPVIAKPVSRPQSFLPPPGFSQMGVGGAGIRPQSRIPAPGIAKTTRLSRPSTAGSRQLSTNNKQQPDWRDGCY